jgi:hypothetical protein
MWPRKVFGRSMALAFHPRMARQRQLIPAPFSKTPLRHRKLVSIIPLLALMISAVAWPTHLLPQP